MGEFRKQLNFNGEGYSFEVLHQGRCGDIVYMEGEKILKIYWEMPGVKELDMLIWPDLTKWEPPVLEAIPYEKQREILARLRNWLTNEGLKTDIDLPLTIKSENEPCIWSGCGNDRVMGSAYCLEHIDYTTLKR